MTNNDNSKTKRRSIPAPQRPKSSQSTSSMNVVTANARKPPAPMPVTPNRTVAVNGTPQLTAAQQLVQAEAAAAEQAERIAELRRAAQAEADKAAQAAARAEAERQTAAAAAQQQHTLASAAVVPIAQLEQLLHGMGIRGKRRARPNDQREIMLPDGTYEVVSEEVQLAILELLEKQPIVRVKDVQEMVPNSKGRTMSPGAARGQLKSMASQKLLVLAYERADDVPGHGLRDVASKDWHTLAAALEPARRAS